MEIYLKKKKKTLNFFENETFLGLPTSAILSESSRFIKSQENCNSVYLQILINNILRVGT